MPSSCLRCADNHKSSNCPHADPTTKKVPDAVLKCIGCGKNHSARFRDCEKRTQYLNIKESAKKRNQNPSNKSFVSTHHGYNLNFPSLSQSRQTTSTHQYQPALQYSAQLRKPAASPTEDLYTPQQCFSIFQELYNALLTCKSKAEQVFTISQITFKYIESAVSTLPIASK